MVLPDLGAADFALIGLQLVIVMLPGGLLAAALGMRGWMLAGTAPLLTYAIAGIAGPWTTGWGIGWSPVVLGLSAVAAAAVAAGLRLALGRGRPRWADVPGTSAAEDTWTRGAHLGAAAAVVVATVLGAWAILGGIRRMSTIPQDWDAVFHANGIRWIADTGDASLTGMGQVNWYEIGGLFYPNAYHLVSTVTYQLTDRGIPDVLNAHTALTPGLAALVLAALVRRLGGTPVHVGATAVAAVLGGSLYDMLWRGPLLPYTTGVAVTPAIVLLLVHALDSRGAADRVSGVLGLALGAAGLVCLHPAMAFGAVLLAVPALVWRWARAPRGLLVEAPLLVGAAVLAGLLAATQLLGSAGSAASFPAADWPAEYTWQGATVALLTFGHPIGEAQWVLVVFAALGLLLYHRLGELRWIAVPAAAFGWLFVISAASDEPWVTAITRPWWNDRWRLVGIFVLIAAVLVGHGVSQAYQALAALTSRVRVPRAVPLALVALVAVLFSGGLYLSLNTGKMTNNTDGDHGISQDEIDSLTALAEIVPPGTRVMNDRYDGSVWMYALTGLHPVAGHYDGTHVGSTDVGVLERGFRFLDSDPEVQQAIRDLDVGYVWVGEGYLRADGFRVSGLVDLPEGPLEEVLSSTDGTAYRLADDWDRPADPERDEP